MKTTVAVLSLLVALGACSANEPTVVDEEPSASTGAHTGQPQEGGGAPLPSDSPGTTGTARFNQVYKFPDGVEVSIPRIQKKSEGIIFTVKIKNNGVDTFDTTDVEVNATYGADGIQADSAYTLDSDDYFEGKVLPKRSRSATYSFKIPASGRGDVQLEVYPSYDGDPAVFQGSLR
jgi:hypothetical protein